MLFFHSFAARHMAQSNRDATVRAEIEGLKKAIADLAAAQDRAATCATYDLGQIGRRVAALEAVDTADAGSQRKSLTYYIVRSVLLVVATAGIYLGVPLLLRTEGIYLDLDEVGAGLLLAGAVVQIVAQGVEDEFGSRHRRLQRLVLPSISWTLVLAGSASLLLAAMHLVGAK